ncbi:MAG: DUF4037 domain-containing protein [Clostridia bacterium]|nr:DUF4037 domain-containing protein [Clostridia bacterium]
MNSEDKVLNALVERFAALEEVEAILLAGSRTTNTQDKNSDYDLYMYTTKDIEVAKREKIIKEFCDYTEINNQFWETEDDAIIRDINVPVEIIYRDFKWLDEQLERVVLKCQGDVGYTTCFWSNFITSHILYDKNGKAKELQEKYKIPYPGKLKLSIIRKNYPLLKDQMPAYYHQIEKAIKRNDYISINHRIAALLASYFDILFAINEMPHPGEKKLVKILKEKCSKLPADLEENLDALIKSIANVDNSILAEIDKLIDNLDRLLEEENIKV